MRKNRILQVQTVITHDTVFTGNIESSGNVTVQGKVEGNIRAGSLTIAGLVEGDVKVTGLLKLTETTVITGNICAHLLSMSDGGIFNGQYTIY